MAPSLGACRLGRGYRRYSGHDARQRLSGFRPGVPGLRIGLVDPRAVQIKKLSHYDSTGSARMVDARQGGNQTHCARPICCSDVALRISAARDVYERTVGYGYLSRGVSIAYLEQIEAVAEALVEVHPTMTAAVPRFFEKLYANILEKGHRETGLKRKIFDWALAWRRNRFLGALMGRRRAAVWSYAGKSPTGLSFRRFARGWAAGFARFCSGGAPLALELDGIFWSLNVPVYQVTD